MIAIIGIVILNYITYLDAIGCIKSIKQTFINKYKIYLVDNASPNNSFEELTNEFGSDTEVEIIGLDMNEGYAVGNNVGIKKAVEDGCRYILVSNSDVIYYDQSINKLFDFIECQKDAGIVGPVTHRVNKEAYYYVRKEMKFIHIISKNKVYRYLFRHIKSNSYFYEPEDLKDKTVVGCVQGCCMLMRVEALQKINFFDENTFLYMEEPILERKLSKTNYKTYYFPYAHIIHIGGTSTAKISIDAQIYSASSQYYYCKKYLNAKIISLIKLNIFNFIYLVLILIKYKRENKWESIKKYFYEIRRVKLLSNNQQKKHRKILF